MHYRIHAMYAKGQTYLFWSFPPRRAERHYYINTVLSCKRSRVFSVGQRSPIHKTFRIIWIRIVFFLIELRLINIIIFEYYDNPMKLVIIKIFYYLYKLVNGKKNRFAFCFYLLSDIMLQADKSALWTFPPPSSAPMQVYAIIIVSPFLY